MRRRPEEGAFAPGYRAARRLREILNLPSGSAACAPAVLARHLGNPKYEPGNGFLPVDALVSRRAGAPRVHPGHPDPAPGASRFLFARAIGDAVCFPEDENSVMNRLHRAGRQATNRAFAAEFLAPIQQVQDVRENGRNDHEIAADLGVSVAVVAHQLENRHRISSTDPD